MKEKYKQLNIRITPKMKRGLEIAAARRGLRKNKLILGFLQYCLDRDAQIIIPGED